MWLAKSETMSIKALFAVRPSINIGNIMARVNIMCDVIIGLFRTKTNQNRPIYKVNVTTHGHTKYDVLMHYPV